MNLSRPLLAAAVLLSTPVVAAAQEANAKAEKPAATAVSPAATELARLLVPREMWAQGVQQIASNVEMQLQGHPGSKLEYPKDLPARVKSEVEAALPYDDLVGMHAQELFSAYSAPELGELLTFYRTPTGKKWLQVQPKTYEKVSIQTEKRLNEKLPAIMNKLGGLAKKPTPAPGTTAKPPAAHGAPKPAAPKK